VAAMPAERPTGAYFIRSSAFESGNTFSSSLDGCICQIQVAECLEGARRYVQDRVLQARIVAIFEENDISASAYSKKKRPDFQRLIELIKRNKIDIILATEVERLVRQPAEAEQLIDLAGATDLREIHLTSEEGYNLSVPSGVCRLRQAVNLAEVSHARPVSVSGGSWRTGLETASRTVVVDASATRLAIWR
jgi:Resolvase, N terminal domain